MVHSDNARTQDAEAGWFQVRAIQQHLDIILARQSKEKLHGSVGNVPAAKTDNLSSNPGLSVRVNFLSSEHTCATDLYMLHSLNMHTKCKFKV